MLDLPVLVSTAFADRHRVAYLNPATATAAGVAIESLTPGAIWTVLRELPAGAGLVVDPAGDETLSFAPDEVDAVLGIEPGSDRGDASLLSRRRRAELATTWVLFHRGPDGRPLAPIVALAAQGIPVEGVWAVGYRLERARSQILLVVDARLDQPWASIIPAVEAGMRGTSFPPDQPVSAVSLAEVSLEFHDLIRSTPNHVA